MCTWRDCAAGALLALAALHASAQAPRFSSDCATLCAVSPTLATTCARVLRSVSTAIASPTSTRATSAMAVYVT